MIDRKWQEYPSLHPHTSERAFLFTGPGPRVIESGMNWRAIFEKKRLSHGLGDDPRNRRDFLLGPPNGPRNQMPTIRPSVMLRQARNIVNSLIP